MPSAPPSAERADVAHEDVGGIASCTRGTPRLAPTSAPQKIVSSAAAGGSRDQLQVFGEHARASMT